MNSERTDTSKKYNGKPPHQSVTANVFPQNWNNITCLANPLQSKIDAVNLKLKEYGIVMAQIDDGRILQKKGW